MKLPLVVPAEHLRLHRFSSVIFSLATILGVTFSPCAASAGQRPAVPASPADAFATLLHSINPALDSDVSRRYAGTLLASASRADVDPLLVVALVSVESGWNRRALSWHGAIGLGQLMPATARRFRIDPHDATANLRATALYLHELLAHFHEQSMPRLALAGYNAGPGAVEKFGGIPPYPETQRYVRKVLDALKSVRGRYDAYRRAFTAPADVDGSPWAIERLAAKAALHEAGGAVTDNAREVRGAATTADAGSEADVARYWSRDARYRRAMAIVGNAGDELELDANARLVLDTYLAGANGDGAGSRH